MLQLTGRNTVWTGTAKAKTARNSLFSGLSSGAPRQLKLGAIASPWRYQAALEIVLRSTNALIPAIVTT
jgi:hypothetical protein